jgi:2-phosphosulfolactate phosphatase
MEIRRLSLISGAKNATGLAVIIDVFRAFTTAAYAFSKGAAKIIPVSSVEEALELKKLHPDWITMGEKDGIKVEAFDYGNSPYEIMEVPLIGRTIVQRTSAGTQGIVNAVNASEILPGSFVIADAIVDYIKARNPETVSLVAMGWGGVDIAPEDEFLADYLQTRLHGEEPDFHDMKLRIRECSQGAKFFDPAQPQFVEGDFHASMDLNRFNFILKVVGDGRPYIKSIAKPYV